MKPSIYRRIRRRTTTEAATNKKENKPESSFFGESAAEHFFQPKPAAATSHAINRKCADCEQEDKNVQRAEDKKEEDKKLQRMTEKKEEDKLQRQPEKKEEETLMKKEEEKKEESILKKGDEKEEEKVQKKEAGGSTAAPITTSYIHSLGSKGTSLPGQAQQFFSSKMGYDFSNVKVHTDKEAAQSAKEVNAKAYTTGEHIVFNEGQYDTTSAEGKKLMAHELAHVVQQNNSAGEHLIRKKPKAAAAPAKKPTAADAPKLKLIKSDPNACALLLVIHNDEENAKRIAKAIAANCSYNLLLLEPGSKRDMKIPGNGALDPNGLFPPEVAEMCFNKSSECDEFLASKASSNDPADILRYVQIQFFMTIKKHSNNFGIPVVALHNNSINDTQKYRAKKDKTDLSDMKKDIEKTDPETDEAPAKELRKMLDKKFGEQTKKELMQKGKTNIFLWCASKDITKCHIGDPHNPDHVIWVTKEADFNQLKRKNVNVAYQDRVPKSPDSKSLNDLSTLFPRISGLQAIQYSKILFDLITWVNSLPPLLDSIKPQLMMQVHLEVLKAWAEASQRLRYVNVETPGLAIGDRTDAERVDDFKFIADVLQSLGIYCCGKDAAHAEAKIEESLKTKSSK